MYSALTGDHSNGRAATSLSETRVFTVSTSLIMLFACRKVPFLFSTPKCRGSLNSKAAIPSASKLDLAGAGVGSKLKPITGTSRNSLLSLSDSEVVLTVLTVSDRPTPHSPLEVPSSKRTTTSTAFSSSMTLGWRFAK